MCSSRAGMYPLLLLYHTFCALLFVATPTLLPQACLHLLHVFSLRGLSDGPSWGSYPSCLPLRDLSSQSFSGLFLKFQSVTPRAAQNPTHSQPWDFCEFPVLCGTQLSFLTVPYVSRTPFSKSQSLDSSCLY